MENNDVEEVEIFAHTDDFLIMQICAVLEDNNIEYFKINEGVGEYISLVFGKSHEMKRIIKLNVKKLIKYFCENYKLVK